MSRVFVKIIGLSLAVTTIEGFDIQAAGVAAPKLAPLLHLTPHQMGFFFAAATFGMMVGAVIGGLAADRIGRRAGLVLSLAVFGAFTCATAYASTFEVLFLCRLLTGIGLGGALPSVVAAAAEAVDVRRRGAAVGVVYAGLPLGGALASAAAIGLAAWQSLFLLGAVLPLLLVPPVLRFFPASRSADAPHRTDAATGGIFAKDSRTATLLLWAGFFLSALVLYLFLNWQPVLLVSKGFAGSSASLVQVAFNVSGVAASILAGLMSDTAERRLLAVVSAGLTVLSIVYFVMLPPSLPMAVLAGACLGAGIVSGQSILYGLAPQLYGAAVRGTGVGWAVGMGRFGSVVGPIVAGVLTASGKTAAEVLMGILPIAVVGGLAAVLLTFVLERSRPAAGRSVEGPAPSPAAVK